MWTSIQTVMQKLNEIVSRALLAFTGRPPQSELATAEKVNSNDTLAF